MRKLISESPFNLAMQRTAASISDTELGSDCVVYKIDFIASTEQAIP
jgi:hypothetical protein